MKILFLRSSFYVLLLFAPLAWSGDAPLTYDRVALRVSASDEVNNDILVAVLYAHREGNDAKALAAEVNQAVAWGLEQAKAEAQVQAQTLAYRTDPVYQKQHLSGWRVSQEIRLQSREAGRLSDLIGRLQERLAVRSIDYKLSEEQRQVAEDRLLVEAIAAFKRRASLVAEQLGRADYRMVEMDLSGNSQSPRPRYARMAAMQSDAAPAPALEAGTQKVEVQVSGTIELALP